MAKAAGITMSECRLFEENGKAHFMTKRFDRTGEKGEKLPKFELPVYNKSNYFIR